MQQILKVQKDAIGTTFTPNGTATKAIVLGTLNAYEKDGVLRDGFVATMFGEAATQDYHQGEVIVADVQTSCREYEGRLYNDIVIREAKKLG